MKKSISKIFGLAALSIVAFVSSCSSDDNAGDTPSTSFVLDRNDFKGDVNEGEVVLESGTYTLTGRVTVKDGAKLTIKPGVTVEASSAATDGIIRYIAVAQGGEIHVQGTASAPVVMTSADKTPGSWGGLVLCGKAPINKGAPAQAEVSGLAYGGTDASDSSGSIKYLRIEYSGYAYNSEKEFNGLSMFGVGNGTTLEYIQIHEGSDDGFEWFGGTANAKYLVVTNFHQEVGDDLFDWTEGWSGTGENWYGIRKNASNRGIEADNNSNDHMATPISNPTIKNLTLIGNGIDGGGENQAMKLRVGTKAQFDNVVLKDWGTGFDIQHDEGIGYVADGQLKATRVKFDNVGVESKGTDTAGNAADVSGVYSVDQTATGAGNGTAKPAWAEGWTVGF